MKTFIHSNQQRQMLLTSYLLTHKGPIPTVIQSHNGKLCQVQFTRAYFTYLSQGNQPLIPMDLLGVDDILMVWDSEEVAR